MGAVDLLKRNPVKAWLDKPRDPMSPRRIIGSLTAAALATGIMAVCCLALFDTSDSDLRLRYNDLDYDVKVLENGDMRIVEHVDVNLPEHESNSIQQSWHRLYQRYRLKSPSLLAITDVGVRDVTSGRRYTKDKRANPADYSDSQWDSAHSGHWYIADLGRGEKTDNHDYDPAGVKLKDEGKDVMGLVAKTKGAVATDLADDRSDASVNTGDVPKSDNAAGKAQEPRDGVTIEIGWNIPSTVCADSMKFDIAMTFRGVCTAHPDVSYFKWEPVGDDNDTPIAHIGATVKFPNGVTSADSWAWLHYKGTSSTWRDGDGTLHFSAAGVPGRQHVDLVGMFAGDYTSDMARTGDGAAKESIINIESWEGWRSRFSAIRGLFVVTMTLLEGLAVAIVLLKLALSSNMKAKAWSGLGYWRELPDVSPACAARLFAMCTGGYQGEDAALRSREMSATLLSLARKKAIGIYPGRAWHYRGIDLSAASFSSVGFWLRDSQRGFEDSDSKTCTIVILPVCSGDTSSLHLTTGEEGLLGLMQSVEGQSAPVVFGFDDFLSDLKDNNGAEELVQEYDKSVEYEFNNPLLMKPDDMSIRIIWVLAFVVAVIAVKLSTFHPGLFLLTLVCASILVFIAQFGRSFYFESQPTDVGLVQVQKVLGLYRYLVDFSDLKERDIPDLTLWDGYLVYAAAFGIIDSVVAQLEGVFPDKSSVDWASGIRDSSLFWLYGGYYVAGMGLDSTVDAGQSSFDGSVVGSVPDLGGSWVSDIGSQISAGFAEVLQTVGSSDGSFSGGGSGGSDGGSGGGSFGGD